MKSDPMANDYTEFLTEVKGRIQTARLQAGRAVNRELVMLYWDIGRGIVEKQKTAGWGDSVVERLAADLRAEFPDMRGFSPANIWRMRQLYELHSCPEFLAQVAREMTKEEILRFEPEHAGKKDFYLNLLNEKERGPDDRPSIGIILCAEKDDVEVEFALKTKANPIGVAEYRLQGTLPAEFKGKLPTAKQLADVAREVLPATKATAGKRKS